MFGVLQNCCGSKQIDKLDKARLMSTLPNWDIPPWSQIQSNKDLIQAILQAIRDKQQQQKSERVLNSILIHLNQANNLQSRCSVLKFLVILDLIVEERQFLQKIQHQSNAQLEFIQGTSNTHEKENSLISSYYFYIKGKAKYYQDQSCSLMNARKRQESLDNLKTLQVLAEINVCFKIQSLIIDIDEKYKCSDGRGQRQENKLVEYIFGLLLKTYMFCHSIVYMALKSFAKRVMDLTHYDLEYLRKFVQYYRKGYTNNFNTFIKNHQEIETFQALKSYPVLEGIEKLNEIINERIQQLEFSDAFFTQIEEIPRMEQKQLMDSKQQIRTYDTSQSENKIQRKEIQSKLKQNNSSVFKEYSNFYSQSSPPVGLQKENQNFMTPADLLEYYKQVPESSNV